MSEEFKIAFQSLDPEEAKYPQTFDEFCQVLGKYNMSKQLKKKYGLDTDEKVEEFHDRSLGLYQTYKKDWENFIVVPDWDENFTLNGYDRSRSAKCKHIGIFQVDESADTFLKVYAYIYVGDFGKGFDRMYLSSYSFTPGSGYDSDLDFIRLEYHARSESSLVSLKERSESLYFKFVEREYNKETKD